MNKKLLLTASAALLLGAALWRVGSERKSGSTAPAGSSRPAPAPVLASSNSLVLGPALEARLGEVFGPKNESLYARYKTLERLTNGLSLAHCETLVEFLETPLPSADLALSSSLKNGVMDRLEGQANLPAPWHQILIELVQNPDLDSVTRDYALQHLFTWHEQILGQQALRTAREEMRVVMWSALNVDEAAISGTALLGLASLIELDPEIPVSRVAEAAAELLRREGANPFAVKITALQVCGRLKVTAAAPMARSLAQASTNIALRASAIAALGQLGDSQSDADILQDLSVRETHRLLKPVIEQALKSVAGRTNG